MALSRPPLGQKRRKEREQKGEGENREKQEETKGNQASKARIRLFQGDCSTTLSFLAISKVNPWNLDAFL